MKQKIKSFIALFLSFSLVIFIGCSRQTIESKILSPSEINKLSKEITVSINGGISGSGVLAAFKDGKYYVLTTKENLTQPDTVSIITKDGKTHTVENIILLPDENLAIGSFVSNDYYVIANILSSRQQVNEGDTVFVTGYNSAGEAISDRRHQFVPGKILNEPKLQRENRLSYNNKILNGMAGGAVLDEAGLLIGINAEDGHGFSVEHLFDSENSASILSSTVRFFNKSDKELKTKTKRSQQEWRYEFLKGDNIESVDIDREGYIYLLCSLGGPLQGKEQILSLLKLNQDGELLWTQSIRSLKEENGNFLLGPYHLLVTAKNEIYVASNVTRSIPQPPALPTSEHLTTWVALLDEDGSLIWEEDIDSPTNPDFNFKIRDAYSDASGNLYITGGGTHVEGNQYLLDSLFMKINKRGDVAWEKTSKQSFFRNVDGIGEDSIYVSGGSSLLKTDGNGTLVLEKKILLDTDNASIEDVLADNDEYFYSWGKTSRSLMGFNPQQESSSDFSDAPTPLDNFWLTSHAADGTLQWKDQSREKDLTFVLPSDESGYFYIYKQNLIAPHTTPPSSRSREDFYAEDPYILVYKYSRDGELIWTSKLKFPKRSGLSDIKIISAANWVYCFGRSDHSTSWFTRRRTGIYFQNTAWVAKYHVKT